MICQIVYTSLTLSQLHKADRREKQSFAFRVWYAEQAQQNASGAFCENYRRMIVALNEKTVVRYHF